MDRLLELHRPTIRGKNSTGPLSVNFLNNTVVAAWRIYCQLSQQKVSHPEFRRQVALCLLKADEEPQNRLDCEAELPLDVRLDRINHFRGRTSQGRCKMYEYKKNTKTMCIESAIIRFHAELCKLGFAVYHTK